MTDTVLLRVTTKERDMIVTALHALADEYRHLIGANVSNYLRDGFEQDSKEAIALARDIKLVEPMMTKAELEAAVYRMLELNPRELIPAIKLYRTHTAAGLHEAKQACEKIRNQIEQARAQLLANNSHPDATGNDSEPPHWNS